MQVSKFPFLNITHHPLKSFSSQKYIQKASRKPDNDDRLIKGSERERYLQSPLGNIREIKSKNSDHREAIQHPYTHRYTKSSFRLRDKNEDPTGQDKNRQNSITNVADSAKPKKKSTKLISSYKKQRHLKIKVEDKMNSHHLLESFLCKSIEPSSTKRQLQIKSNNSDSKNLNNSHQEIEKNSLKQQLRKNRKQESSSVVVPNKAFLTKIKKKRVESNPHLLATIIKRKQEVLSKNQLYDYVKKIIQKCSK